MSGGDPAPIVAIVVQAGLLGNIQPWPILSARTADFIRKIDKE
jgi:hypothetical protein